MTTRTAERLPRILKITCLVAAVILVLLTAGNIRRYVRFESNAGRDDMTDHFTETGDYYDLMYRHLYSYSGQDGNTVLPEDAKDDPKRLALYAENAFFYRALAENGMAGEAEAKRAFMDTLRQELSAYTDVPDAIDRLLLIGEEAHE